MRACIRACECVFLNVCKERESEKENKLQRERESA